MTDQDTGTNDVVLAVHSQDGQYHLRSTDTTTNPWPGSTDGLFVGEEGWVAVLCGTQFGPIHITVRQYGERPAIDPGWDMAAEWTLDCPDGTLTLSSIYSGQPEDITVTTGLLRIRVSVRGRAAASALSGPLETPAEHHLHEYWPVTSHEDPVVVHGPDELAQYLI